MRFYNEKDLRDAIISEVLELARLKREIVKHGYADEWVRAVDVAEDRIAILGGELLRLRENSRR